MSTANPLHVLTILFLLVFLNACSNEKKPEDQATEGVSLDEKLFVQHIEKLSSDEFGGRMPFSEQEPLTLEYLENYLKALGVSPANNGSYRQSVPMVEITSVPEDDLVFSTPNGEMNLKVLDEFVVQTERPIERVEINNSELVFCGYGIVAPEYGWNDYEGLDMKGKTAVVLVNDPGLGSEDESFFKGNTMTYYGRWTYKFEEADRQGADGLILIHETNMAGYPWFVVRNGWSGPQLHLKQDKTEDCGIKGWIQLDQAKALFSNCDLDLGVLLKEARKPGFKPVSMNATATIAVNTTLKEDKSDNIVGIIEGDESPEEYLIYTAHWDHMGIGNVVDGDSIYNGALDNASGTSSLLCIAEKFMAGKNKPNRSVVFLFVTAEEQGLLGSAWYAENPIFPISKTVCNINLDGINFVGPSNDLTITGYGHSQMDEIAEAVAKKQGRYVQGEQEPEKGYFFRSDHFNFAKKGVPALYAKGGYDHREKGKEYALELQKRYRKEDYHQPSDEFVPGQWDLRGAMEDIQLYYEIGQSLGNSTVWPRWKEGSSFKSKDIRKTDD